MVLYRPQSVATFLLALLLGLNTPEASLYHMYISKTINTQGGLGPDPMVICQLVHCVTDRWHCHCCITYL
jgi:hypothetical protein